jgi:predicted nucleic acid-binding protein
MMGRSEETREKNRREIEAAMQGMTIPPLPFEEYRHLLIRPTYLPVVDLAQIERWRAEAAGALERIQVVPPEWVFDGPIVQPNENVLATLASLVSEPSTDAVNETETVERELALV